MKYLTCILSLICLTLVCYAPDELPDERGATELEYLFYAVCIVESELDSTAIGRDNDRGIAQITPILELDYFQRKGRRINPFCVKDSREVFMYYAEKRGPEIERIARRWNAGGKWKGEKAERYWQKVNRELNKITI